MWDYFSAYTGFDLATAQAVFARNSGNEVNAAIECCDRWCGQEKTALFWAGEEGEREEWTFEQLRDESGRMANLLRANGLGRGDRIAGLLPRTPAILVTILAVWRIGAVYQPLFTAFGPKAIDHRLTTGKTAAIVTDPTNRTKLDGLSHVPKLFVTSSCKSEAGDDIDLSTALPTQSPVCEPTYISDEEPFLLMFTSGTTGAPKSLTVPVKALAAFVGYMRDAVGLTDNDRFWNVADPGWAYGLYYAVAGPLAMGCATQFYSGPFSAESTVNLIAERKITNLAGSPTAFRLLMAAGPEMVSRIKGSLKAVSSAGEALNPEIARWFDEHLAAPVRDHYGQTELGMVVCNHHALAHPVTPGSAGFSVPGHRVVVVDETGNELPPHEPGILAVDKARSPLFWFSGYEQGGDATITGYYLSGDVVELNDDGSISFVGRADDVITSSGYRIGPFDVESALVEHPAVVEAAVVGKPDPERTELVKAFVVLASDFSPTDETARELQQFVRTRLSAHAYPRELEFVDELPKTPSGKIQRFLLRAR